MNIGSEAARIASHGATRRTAAGITGVGDATAEGSSVVDIGAPLVSNDYLIATLVID
jgi:hypothetical protein